jgi:hypothetical protein
MSARADLCGGRSAMIVPTATSVINLIRLLAETITSRIAVGSRAIRKLLFSLIGDPANFLFADNSGVECKVPSCKCPNSRFYGHLAKT